MSPNNEFQNRPSNDQGWMNQGMASGTANNNMMEEENTLDLQDFFSYCISKWKWFAGSIIVCLGIACVYLLCTPKTYTRIASVMIKSEDGNSQSAMGVASALSNMGLFSSSADVNNELLAFNSPAIIGDVIKRLDLQTDYVYKRRLRPITLFGDSLPLKVTFTGLPEAHGVTFKAAILGKGKVELSDIRGGERNTLIADSKIVTLGDTVNLPVGYMTVNAGPNYSTTFEPEITVTHSPLPRVITAYQKKLSEELPDDRATVIDFSFSDVNKQRADAFLTTLIDIYNEKWVEDKAQIERATSKFIAERLAEIEDELSKVDSNIADYKGQNLVPDIVEASKLYMETANDNLRQQLEVNTQIAITKSLVDYMSKAANENELLPSNSGIENPGVESQIQDYNRLQMQRDKLARTSGESSPVVQDYTHNLASMRRAIIGTLNNQIVGLKTQLATLEKEDRATNTKIATSPSQAKYLLSVERKQKVVESLYLYLLQKGEENKLSLAFTPFNTRVITPPMGPLAHAAPKASSVLLIAFILGLIIPAAILFLDKILDTRLRNAKDLEGLRTPYLGEIPEAGKQSRNSLRRMMRRWRDNFQKASHMEAAPDLLVHKHGRSVINESFRMLRANLEFVTRNEHNKVIMITSFNPGSGKSFISLNLSAALAVKSSERKILLIDLDLRRASVSRTVPKHQRGITDYLTEAVADFHTLIQPTACEGLSLLPVGTIPPNPSELLYSDRLRQLIETARQEYDYIILDCPPSEVVADASIVSPLCDTTIFVVRAGLLDRRMIPHVDRLYDSHRFRNFMLVLNGTISETDPYRRHVYYSYYTSSKEHKVEATQES